MRGMILRKKIGEFLIIISLPRIFLFHFHHPGTEWRKLWKSTVFRFPPFPQHISGKLKVSLNSRIFSSLSNSSIEKVPFLRKKSRLFFRENFRIQFSGKLSLSDAHVPKHAASLFPRMRQSPKLRFLKKKMRSRIAFPEKKEGKSKTHAKSSRSPKYFWDMLVLLRSHVSKIALNSSVSQKKLFLIFCATCRKWALQKRNDRFFSSFLFFLTFFLSSFWPLLQSGSYDERRETMTAHFFFVQFQLPCFFFRVSGCCEFEANSKNEKKETGTVFRHLNPTFFLPSFVSFFCGGVVRISPLFPLFFFRQTAGWARFNFFLSRSNLPAPSCTHTHRDFALLPLSLGSNGVNLHTPIISFCTERKRRREKGPEWVFFYLDFLAS